MPGRAIYTVLMEVQNPSSVTAQDAELVAEQRQVRALAARDREVRAHEQAHAAVGGQYAGSPHYDYTRGPNGVSYATSGHVNIDISPVPGDPRFVTLAQGVRHTCARRATSRW